ncbi:MAG: tetratricopeptide repeat protein [Nitrospirae bacterium]|nr:tetratricopeptide repeat protein [Nitrospirota bacterium]
MKKAVLIFAVICLMGASILSWFTPPLISPVNGFDISLSPVVSLNTHSSVISSFSILLIIMAIGVILSLWSSYSYIVFHISMGCIFTTLYFILKAAFLDHVFLEDVLYLHQQHLNMIKFSSILPVNVGFEPTLAPRLLIDGLFTRIYVLFYFLSYGWYLTFITGIMLLFYCFRSVKNPDKGKRGLRAVTRTVIIWGFAFIGIVAYSVAPYIISEYYVINGDKYMEAGNPVIAEKAYRKILDRNDIFDTDSEFQNRLGVIAFSLGKRNNTEYHFYMGNLYSEQRRYDMAEFEYKKALELSSGDMHKLLIRSLEELYNVAGLIEYTRGNSSYGVQMWEKAQQLNPSGIQTYYYLSKAYYDSGNYQKAMSYGEKFLSLSGNNILNSNINATIGDCYYKLGDPVKGRTYYEKAKALDLFGNYRILKSLGGT